jgi:hypothetical protein
MRKTAVTILLFIVTVVFFHTGESSITGRPKVPDFQLPVNLKTGDIIFRNGKGIVSAMFRCTSQEKKYTHAGVVILKNEIPYVFHMIGNANGKCGLKTETLESFCNKTTNYGIAVYRYKCFKGNEDKINVYYQKLKKCDPVFDESFNLETDNALYCSEMIYKMTREITGLCLPHSYFSNEKYISIDNLYRNNLSIALFKKIY